MYLKKIPTCVKVDATPLVQFHIYRPKLNHGFAPHANVLPLPLANTTPLCHARIWPVPVNEISAVILRTYRLRLQRKAAFQFRCRFEGTMSARLSRRPSFECRAP